LFLDYQLFLIIHSTLSITTDNQEWLFFYSNSFGNFYFQFLCRNWKSYTTVFLLYLSGCIHPHHWYAQNVMIPCRSQELLPFLSVIYFSLLPFTTH
jgi:hypothetical protein